ncbi:MAG: hypothetical protein NC094_02065 [Bacteroidales bacterium]|nr:hypothetical protein [Lachnoclostridium sp.]MCM1383535.1 hypothetical protein [Lachnoclostridium sp.]MCM1464182.1 hypothetical protein [Bacteroidales bacterium]
MNKTTYEDYKYSMQDVSNLYIGAKYTFGELLAQEDILFKFRLIVERYIMPEADREDTLESHLYYLDKNSFLVQIYKQLKARIKVNLIEEKKTLSGGKKKEYTTKMLTAEELTGMSIEEKQKCGMVIQELKVSKLAMLSF